MAWRFDPTVAIGSVLALALYVTGVARHARVRRKPWPVRRTVLFTLGVLAAYFAIESPLDAAGDRSFTPHMVQHLVLTDVTAPLLLLGGPVLLVLGIAPTKLARRIVGLLRSRLAHAITFPVFTWFLFMLSLWSLHFTPFYEAALESEPLHLLEHVLYLATAALFWLPVIAIGPTPWTDGALAFPLRMLYLMMAMPAEGFLGFALFNAHHVMYARYTRAGLEDQQYAGELMWVGGSFAMFVAFMFVGYEWAKSEQRRGAKMDERRERAADELAALG